MMGCKLSIGARKPIVPMATTNLNVERFNCMQTSCLAAALLLGALAFPTHAADSQPSPAAVAAAAKSVEAATAFLNTLSEQQRAAVVFAFDDETQRKRWSNLPTPMFKRTGLRLADLNPTQRDAALKLLAAMLSPMGYEKTIGIMEGDETLKTGGAGGPVFGRDEYYFSILGKPSTTEPWMLQFGGHHLALNITVYGPRGVMTPSHTATQPSAFTLNGKTIRPLAGEYDKSFLVLNSLNEDQKRRAIIGSRMADLVLGPGHDGQTIQPEGLKASEMTEAQRALLLDLIHEWVGMIQSAAAEQKMTEVKDGLRETWFAWSGPTAPGSAAYYRIQGPTVFIEFAPQKLGGVETNHLHTMYRDPSNDYGRKFAKP
jgi:hypothetical protein